MRIGAITVNAAGMAAGTGVQGRFVCPCNDQAQGENGGTFGSEYKVTISQEGRDLSRQRKIKTEKKARDTQSVKDERMLLRKQEEAKRSKEIREGYREKLNEIDETIRKLNDAYPEPKKWKPGDDKEPYDAKMMDEVMRNRQDLREAMQSQKDFQVQENQRLAKEAQKMAMQSAKYNQEVDENNRDLATLLKTMEEAEKAQEEQENGGEKESGSSGESSTQASAGGMMQASAVQFMTSSVNREWAVEQMLSDFQGDGAWFLGTADSITREVLQKTEGIRAALEDENVTDEQLAEMMKNIQDGIGDIYENVENYRGWGLQVLRLAREDKIQHIADAPLKGMQGVKKGLMASASDVTLGEAGQSGLDKVFQELADEVKELVDRRNDVDRTPQEKEGDEKEKEEKKEEQVQLRGELSQTEKTDGK